MRIYLKKFSLITSIAVISSSFTEWVYIFNVVYILEWPNLLLTVAIGIPLLICYFKFEVQHIPICKKTCESVKYLSSEKKGNPHVYEK